MHTRDGKAPAEGKRPYRPPQLIVYGTIVELTQSGLMGMGVFDGGVIPGKMMMIKFLKSAL